MPNNVTPIDLARLAGRDKKDPQRYRDREAPPESDRPVGGAPELRPITFEEAWAEILDMCPDGVLTRRDRGMVFEAARLHMQIRNATMLQLMEGKVGAVIDTKISKLYQSYLARLGCSPTDCNHVHRQKKPEKGEFDD